MHNAPQPVVTVPNDPNMAHEPAQTIAKLMQIKNALVIIVTMAGYGATFTPAVNGAIEDIIQIGVPAILGLWTIFSTWKQGTDTRAAVYAPSTVAEFIESQPPTPIVAPGDVEDAIEPTDGHLHRVE